MSVWGRCVSFAIGGTATLSRGMLTDHHPLFSYSDGTQLTDTVDLATADAKVDEEAAEKAMKEYNEA